MECMLPWPLQNRNKVDDSKIEDEIQPLTEHQDEKIKSGAKKLIEHWATFSSAYRIPKRVRGNTPEVGVSRLSGNRNTHLDAAGRERSHATTSNVSKRDE
jgi:hypothetical protein